MKVAAIQADLAWCDQESNRVNLWKQMKDAGQCDLYVLPEMFSTGFCTNDKSMAEPLNADGTCASLDWMIKCSNELDAAIVGSVALSTREGCKNRLHHYIRTSMNHGACPYSCPRIFIRSHRHFLRNNTYPFRHSQTYRIFLQRSLQIGFPI